MSKSDFTPRPDIPEELLYQSKLHRLLVNLLQPRMQHIAKLNLTKITAIRHNHLLLTTRIRVQFVQKRAFYATSPYLSLRSSHLRKRIRKIPANLVPVTHTTLNTPNAIVVPITQFIHSRTLYPLLFLR